MKSFLIMLTITLIVCTSCHEIYQPDLNVGESSLVVEGLITNELQTYYVHLYYASPFTSNKTAIPVQLARVTITDDIGNGYSLREKNDGVYFTDSLQLIGVAGRSYTLHIETAEHEVYESTPQLLLPETLPDQVYGSYTEKEYLMEGASVNEPVKMIENVAEIYMDFNSISDTLLRFRFLSTLIYEFLVLHIDWSRDMLHPFYCWRMIDPHPSLNITDEKYNISSNSIKQEPICFFPSKNTVYIADSLALGNPNPRARLPMEILRGDTFIPFIHRILIVKQYRLNNEAYQYYKGINQQLSAEGKIFDPIAVQLYGNIICKTNPKNHVLGFFEASSKSTNAYLVKTTDPDHVQVTKIRTISPPKVPKGFSKDSLPDWWIQ